MGEEVRVDAVQDVLVGEMEEVVHVGGGCVVVRKEKDGLTSGEVRDMKARRLFVGARFRVVLAYRLPNVVRDQRRGQKGEVARVFGRALPLSRWAGLSIVPQIASQASCRGS